MKLSNEIQELLSQHEDAWDIRQKEQRATWDKFHAHDEKMQAAVIAACPVKVGDCVKVDNGGVILVDRVYAYSPTGRPAVVLKGKKLKKNGEVGKMAGEVGLHECQLVGKAAYA